jgi:hypothetical protein
LRPGGSNKKKACYRLEFKLAHGAEMGSGAYRQAMPFFLGLILGQVLVGSAWHLLGLALDIVPYSYWAN